MNNPKTVNVFDEKVRELIGDKTLDEVLISIFTSFVNNLVEGLS